MHQRPDEGAELVGLELKDVEVPQYLRVEARCRARRPFEPSGDGVAGMPRDPGRRRNAHALDAQACNLVELSSRAAKSPVRGARIQADGPAADLAAVPPSSAQFRRKPAVANDVEARLSKIPAPGPEACCLVDRPHPTSVAA